ncbi:17164_t:CDS:2 [Racocetra fulgida]|uniref:17164_t:CDS:1 n=1 Tax=Racocetra fulgida TaxID=60492 RepID=A0A9N8WJM3_9GLOM|nr:17164_t:CDS:2 [Racocetra fulgida]
MQDIYLITQIFAFDDGCITLQLNKLVQKHKHQNIKTFWRYNYNALLYFINNYAEIHGLLLPGCHVHQDAYQTIYFPTADTKRKIYNLYIDSVVNFDDAKMDESTFCHLWDIYIPEIQIMSPQSDLCEVCQHLKYEISHNCDDTIIKTNKYIIHINLAHGE